MLESIHVKNLALIEETEVEFAEGLNIITGETGAGKSLLIGSVNLALGGKFDASLLRKGADGGYVELVFRSRAEAVINLLKEMDIEPEEDDRIILTRKLMQGKSTCKINGESVTAKQVKTLAEELIDIHGQHEHQSLLKKSKHLDILDAYGGDKIKELSDEVRIYYKQYKDAVSELEENEKDTSDIEREKSLLEFEVNEIEAAGLVIGEDTELEEKYTKMANARKIAEALGEAYNYTSASSENAASLVGSALREVSSVSSYDKDIEGLESQLSEIEALMNDFNRDLSGYMNDFTFEEGEYEAVSERLDLINSFKKKYGDSIEKILNYGKEASNKLDKYTDFEGYILGLKEKVKSSEKELLKACEELSKVRKKLSKELSVKLKESLVGLNFLSVEFEIEVRSGNPPTAKGYDDVEFMISTNPGESLKPLGDVASGGELSRIMLGIKTVMAGADSIDTLIFDEIDSGISGRTAFKVSKQLGKLGGEHQVLCITHLPQIAAMADAHYVIEKTASKDSTTTSVRCITGEESVLELARLLGSDEESEAALNNARDMIQKAKEYKNGTGE
ncbi:MAG: DNA repair protein RecN [Lachnospiraceae bacterium]|nr:DNA repair protein RecN [Lachnospiraceae bacterium]